MPTLGNDYPELVRLAEAGQLEFTCPRCLTRWKPNEAEQKVMAENVRKHIALLSA